MFGKRIEKLASLIKDSKKIADIGTDHGYLVIEALLEGKTLKAQAIDNKKMPLLRAKENIASFGLEEKVSFSLSSGLDDLEEDVDHIVMSGYVIDLLKSISAVSDDFKIHSGGSCGKGYKEWVRVSDGGPYMKAKVKIG